MFAILYLIYLRVLSLGLPKGHHLLEEEEPWTEGPVPQRVTAERGCNHPSFAFSEIAREAGQSSTTFSVAEQGSDK